MHNIFLKVKKGIYSITHCFKLYKHNRLLLSSINELNAKLNRLSKELDDERFKNKKLTLLNELCIEEINEIKKVKR